MEAPNGQLHAVSLREYVAKHNLTQLAAGAMNLAASSRADSPHSALYKYFLSRTTPKILGLVGRQVFDSRGEPTVECEVETYKGRFRGVCPAGDTPGAYEAFELRDGDVKKHLGRGVSRAVRSINKFIAPALLGKDPTKQQEIDALMVEVLDQTANLSALGANAVLAVSIAVCKAGAAEAGVPVYRHLARLAGNVTAVLPVPAFNLLSGGMHSEDMNGLPVQEFMVMPTGAKTFAEAMKWGAEIYHNLKSIISKRFGQTYLDVGHDGAFSPPLADTEEALYLIVEAIHVSGYTGQVKIALDVCATEFLIDDDLYDLGYKLVGKRVRNLQWDGEKMLEYYRMLCRSFPIASIEDPFDMDDFRNTADLTDLGVCQVVGDHLLVNNPARVAAAVKGRVCNALTLKMNQIGTVTETIDMARTAKEAGWGVVACHRSGETEDCFLADLAVGLACGQIKAGAPCRSERMAKFNQLLRIEEQLGAETLYAGTEGSLYRHIPWRANGSENEPPKPPL